MLVSWGYDRSLPFRSGAVAVSPGAASRPAPAVPGRRRWRPRFDPGRRAVRLGPVPVDLGGIGKGLAVRWAAQQLAGAGTATLVEAGGDLQVAGAGPGRRRLAGRPSRTPRRRRPGRRARAWWTRLRDVLGAAAARWSRGRRPVHHLVDPRTGEPADSGLLSVTVVGPDVARAEVWSKALFLAGRGDGAAARRRARPRRAAGSTTDGVVGVSRAMRPHLTWQADRGW